MRLPFHKPTATPNDTLNRGTLDTAIRALGWEGLDTSFAICMACCTRCDDDEHICAATPAQKQAAADFVEWQTHIAFGDCREATQSAISPSVSRY